MSNKKAVHPRMVETEVDILNRAKQVGREEARMEIDTANTKAEAAKSIFEAAGKIKAFNFYRSQSDFFMLIKLKQIKESREYHEKYGMTWAQFCEYCGLKRRRVDEALQDLKPFRDDFLADFANLMNSDFNKIKYLGMGVLADSAKIEGNEIICGKERIPLTKEDLTAFLERLEIAYKDQLKEQKKQADKEIKTFNSQIHTMSTEKDAMVKEINRLKTFEPKSADEEIMQKLSAIDQLLNQADNIMRSFVFTTEDLSDDVFGKASGICKRIRDRFELFENEFYQLKETE